MLKKNYLLVSLIAFLSFQCHGSQGSFEKHKTARQLYYDPSFASLLNGSKDNKRFCLCPNANLDTRLNLGDHVVKDALEHLKKNDIIHITSFGAGLCNSEIIIAQLLKNHGFTNVTINAIDPAYSRNSITLLEMMPSGRDFTIKAFKNASNFSIKPEEKHIFLRIDMPSNHLFRSYNTEEFLDDLSQLDKGPFSLVFKVGKYNNFFRIEVYSLNPLRICINRKQNTPLSTENIFPKKITYDPCYNLSEDILKKIVSFFFAHTPGSSKLSVVSSECAGYEFFKLLSQSELAFCLEFDMIFNYRTTSNGADFDDLIFDESSGKFI